MTRELDASAIQTAIADRGASDRYSYDKAGNLAKVEDLTGTPLEGSNVSLYTVRDYTFTTNGARATLKETIGTAARIGDILT